jgi:hypothetical protein
VAEICGLSGDGGDGHGTITFAGLQGDRIEAYSKAQLRDLVSSYLRRQLDALMASGVSPTPEGPLDGGPGLPEPWRRRKDHVVRDGCCNVTTEAFEHPDGTVVPGRVTASRPPPPDAPPLMALLGQRPPQAPPPRASQQ